MLHPDSFCSVHTRASASRAPVVDPCGCTWGAIYIIRFQCGRLPLSPNNVSRARALLWTDALLSRLAQIRSANISLYSYGCISLSVQPSCAVYGPFEFSVRPVDVDISDDSRLRDANSAGGNFSDPCTCSFGFVVRQNGRSDRVGEGPQLRGKCSDRHRLRQC